MASRIVRYASAALLCGPVFCWLSCGDARAERPLETIEFAVNVHGAAFRCGQTYAQMGVDGGEFTVRDLRFYVHDLELLDAAGEAHPLELTQDGRFQLENIALLDFEGGEPGCDTGTPEHNAVVQGSVPAGAYHGLRFKLGVPFARNHGDQALAPSPLNLTSLFWTWQDGYKFLRFEGDSPESGGFIFHLGSTGCNGDLAGGVTHCAAENVVTVELSEFEPGQQVVLDLGELLSGSNLAERAKDDVGCMADPGDAACAPLFERLGLPVPEHGVKPQRVFHAR
jgi:uncharacterized repeat protein (TIGR04052 family)